jgi:radical SAM superfamily enzyme YgiQ (UPF0313 family)
LGVTYVAAAFEKAGAQVRIFDYLVSGYSPGKLHAQIDDFKPDVLGATSVTMNFPKAAEIVSEAKRYLPSLITMMGGPHVSFTAERSLREYLGIDLIVMGEGEKTIAEMMACGLEHDKLEKVTGIAYRNDGMVLVNASRPFIEDIDTLPLPARHLLPLSRYQALGFPISIITSRGCPYLCIFCQGRKMVGHKVRKRNPALIVDEIEQILSYGIDRINVADDLFVSSPKRVKEVCEEIIRRGLHFTWSAFARVNTVDKETLLLMRETGCDSISFGVETGNEEMIKRVKKKITLDQARHAVSLCREVGIIPHTSFIVGLPGESPETLQETSEFAAGLGSLYGYHLLAPFPGTTVRENIADYDLELLTDDWTKYDANQAIVRTSALSAEQMNRFVADFEGEIAKAWDEMVRGYHNKTTPPDIDMQVEGHFRMELVYRLLSEDLIEKLGVVETEGCDDPYDFAEKELCLRIEKAAGAEGVLLRKTIRDFIEKGYVCRTISPGKICWRWTHNNRDSCG